MERRGGLVGDGTLTHRRRGGASSSAAGPCGTAPYRAGRPGDTGRRRRGPGPGGFEGHARTGREGLRVPVRRAGGGSHPAPGCRVSGGPPRDGPRPGHTAVLDVRASSPTVRREGARGVHTGRQGRRPLQAGPGGGGLRPPSAAAGAPDGQGRRRPAGRTGGPRLHCRRGGRAPLPDDEGSAKAGERDRDQRRSGHIRQRPAHPGGGHGPHHRPEIARGCGPLLVY